MTPRMLEVYDFISKFIREHGYSPSYREIKEAIGVKSSTAVLRLVDALVQRGYIRKLNRRSRSIEIVRRLEDQRDTAHVRSLLIEITMTQELSKAQALAREAMRSLP